MYMYMYIYYTPLLLLKSIVSRTVFLVVILKVMKNVSCLSVATLLIMVVIGIVYAGVVEFVISSPNL